MLALAKTVALLVFCCLSFAPDQTQAAAEPDDRWLGKWLGHAGSERERITIGLEFKRTSDGKMQLLLTQPVSNYFGVDPGALPVINGDTVTLDALALSLTLKDDVLEGHVPGPKSPARLQRARALPTEPALPKLPTGPKPAWQTRLGGQIYASPTVANGVAYIGATGGVFNAINLHDGSIRWTFSAGKPIYGQATVSGNAVYFVCDDGWLYKLAMVDGKQVWRYALGDHEVARITAHPSVYDWDWHAPQPLITDTELYVGSGDGVLHAIDVSSGNRRWRFATQGRIRGGAALSGEQVIVAGSDHHVYALQRSDGRELCRFDSGAAIENTPLVAHGKVYVGNRGGGMYALDSSTGKQDWRVYFWGSWVESTPVLVDGTLYVGSSDLRRISAIEAATGTVQWRSDVYGWTFGTPLIVGERIHVGAAGGTPYFVRHQAGYSTLDSKTGKLLTYRPLPDGGGHQWGIAGSLARDGQWLVYATIDGSVFGTALQD